MAIAMRKSLMAAAGSSSSSAPLLFSDTFTDTQGLALASHTPDLDTFGNGWTINYGVWSIDTNRAKCIDQTFGEYVAWVDSGLTTYTIECKVRTPIANTADLGVVVRWASNQNFIELGIRVDDNRTYARRKNADFNYTVLYNALYPGTLAINTDHQFRVVTTPTNIKWWIDGNLVMNLNNTSYSTATKVGMYRGDDNHRWDDFKVYGGDITA